MLLKGEVVGEWVNHRIMPGTTFGWEPAGTHLIAYADKPSGRLVMMDTNGAKQKVDGTKGVVAPAWSNDGTRLAYLEGRGRNKFALDRCVGLGEQVSTRSAEGNAWIRATPLITAGLVSLAGVLGAQQTAERPPQTAPQQTPAPSAQFAAGVDVVQVDVSVTDKSGQPITDLTARDFDIREDGQPQTIQAIYLLTLD